MTRFALLFLLLGFPLAAFASWRREAAFSAADAEQLPDTLPEPGFLESLALAISNATRGERNNNPGNIRLSEIKWMGKTAGTDTAFETFMGPEQGIRALAVLLRNYQTRQGLRTVRQIISRYAPASENNTAAYIAAVAGEIGVSPDEIINLNDDGTLTKLVTAIIRHENGRVVYSASTIVNGVSQA
jgi:hypothetical protein